MDEDYLLAYIYKGVFVLVLFHVAALAFWVYSAFKEKDSDIRKLEKLH